MVYGAPKFSFTVVHHNGESKVSPNRVTERHDDREQRRVERTGRGRERGEGGGRGMEREREGERREGEGGCTRHNIILKILKCIVPFVEAIRKRSCSLNGGGGGLSRPTERGIFNIPVNVCLDTAT